MPNSEPELTIVTGAASGIGKAVADRLTSQGLSVWRLDRVASSGDDASLACDVADEQSVQRVIDEIAGHGAIAGLVNCAGIGGIGTLTDISMADWDRVMAVNLRGTVLMCRAVLPHLTARRHGSIVNIGSTFGMLARGNCIAYGVSKAAVIHLTRSLAVDLKDVGVRVNCVCPGLIETAMTSPLFGPGAEAERRANLEAHALRRPGSPEEIAAAVSFLLSEDASFITGAAVPVDGGYTAGKWIRP